MNSIERIDEQPTAIDEPLLRLRHVYQDRRSGKDRRMGFTCMDPTMDRRKGERRQDVRRSIDHRMSVTFVEPVLNRRKNQCRRRIAKLFKR